MSLLGTLAKVAIGIAVAKGVNGMMNKRAASPDQGGNGGLLDGLAANDAPQGGGLGDLMGSVLGGAQRPSGGGSAGGLGGLLEQLGGGAGKPRSSGGGLGDLLGGLAGGSAGGSTGGGLGGLGDLLGGLAGKAPQERTGGGTFGELLNGSLQRGGEPEVEPSADDEATAGLLLRAMIQAAKSDGKLDDDERQRLMDNLSDASAEEMDFVNAEFAAPIDVDGLSRQVPQGMEQQVYVMSVMGIKLDDQAEAQYLHELAGAMGLEPSTVNAIHDQLGVSRIYS